jgi:hypothetical protein
MDSVSAQDVAGVVNGLDLAGSQILAEPADSQIKSTALATVEAHELWGPHGVDDDVRILPASDVIESESKSPAIPERSKTTFQMRIQLEERGIAMPVYRSLDATELVNY